MDRREIIRSQIKNCVTETHLPGKKIQGKVRDIYPKDDTVLFVATDRLSAFDRVLAAIPFKGQVLNLTSKWWFEKTAHIIPNHLLETPDPSVTIGKKCDVFMVEFVVRGYMTGSTSTSLWTHYQAGSRSYCGNSIPDGLVKSQKLPHNILTPTTKSEHDEPVSPDEIVSRGIMTRKDLEVCSNAALQLFAYGQEVAQEHRLVLVDTKYEFGKDKDGVIRLIDEIHTPDSSRYWLADSYQERITQGLEPENIDKEFIRLWFREHCDPYHDEVLPEAPEELVVELASRYIKLYEMITGEEFQLNNLDTPATERIAKNLHVTT